MSGTNKKSFMSRAAISIGLGFFGAFWRRTQKEEIKIAIDGRRRVALGRCSVHFIPVVSTLFIVTLNIMGFYIGGELQGPSGEEANLARLNALQFAAKLHELSIIASLTTVVFHVIRSELVFGDGVPFGTLAAGLSFSQLSFLWSPEFLAALMTDSPSKRWWKKSAILWFISIAAILAAVVGPVSAILLIPRLDWFPGGGTLFSIRGSPETLWPTILGVNEIGGNHCLSNTATTSPICPAGGFSSLMAFAGALNLGTYQDLERTILRKLPIVNSKTTRVLIADGKVGLYPVRETVARVAHYSTSSAMTKVTRAWALAGFNSDVIKGNRYRYRFRQDARYHVYAPSPITRVKCLDRKKNNTAPGNDTINFPVFLPFETYDDENPLVKSLETLRYENHTFSESGTRMKVQWVELPEGFGSTTIGAVIYWRAVLNDTVTTNTVSCAVDTRWAPSKMHSTWSESYIYQDITEQRGQGERFFLPPKDGNWVQVKSTIAWAEALNVKLGGGNSTVFENMASQAGLTSWITLTPDDPAAVVELLLATLFTDGVSRVGAGNELAGDRASDWPIQFMKGGSAYNITQELSKGEILFQRRMIAEVQGYGYSAGSKTVNIALVVLLLHIFIAITHTVWTLTQGWSSGSWQSISELVALAVNSRRSFAMNNTCAGINRLNTLKKVVRVMESDEDHLELVFVEDESVKNMERPQQGGRYGKIY